MDFCLIPVDCSVEDYELFQNVAAQRGMSISQWLVSIAKSNAMGATIQPKNMVQSPAPVIETAHKILDSMDVESGVVATPSEKLEVVTTNTAVEPINNHPCAHLATGTYPPGFKANACLGTCLAEGNGNKPCFFSAGVASQCGLFKLKFRKSFF